MRCGKTFVKENRFPDYGERVIIENDVWIGSDVILMDKVTIQPKANTFARIQ